MPTPITEYFNGGLVTARHPALLNPGELQLATDCVYREKDPSIQRAPGRTIYNSTTVKKPNGSDPAGIKGLAYLGFGQQTDQLLVWAEGDTNVSYMWKSPFAGITNSFTILTGPGTLSCTTVSTSDTLVAAAGSFTNMIIGASVIGPGIPSGAFISAIDSDTHAHINVNATASATVTLIFDSGIPVTLNDLSTDVLDTVQWQNSHFLLTRNNGLLRCLWKQPPAASGGTATETLIARVSGLSPIASFPQSSVTVQAGAGWSSVLGNGFYWFLLTEIAESNDPDIPDVEAGYIANEGTAIAVNITAFASQYIQITFPAITNDGTGGTGIATHWGIYMSFIGPGAAAYPDASNMPSAATFRRIAKVAITETAHNIKFNNVTQPLTGFALPTADASIGTGFVSPDNAFTIDNTYTHTSTGGAAEAWSAFKDSAGVALSGGSPWSGYGVTGIQVVVVARVGTPYNSAGFYISLDNGSGKVSVQKYAVANTLVPVAYVFGSQMDNWGASWVPADIATLRVIVQKSFSNASQQIQINYIQVRVFYSGASVSDSSLDLNGPPYQVVTYRSQIGTTVNDPANYIIPNASTGDSFQGSLVLNDVANPSTLRYSIAGAPESFPKPYEMIFNSKTKDIITYIRRLGQLLVVGMRDSIKRVNYLPTEVDVDFLRGVAYEDIITDHGIVGPHAATLMDMVGIGVVIPYIAYNGLYFTDGITSRPLNLDFKLSTLVNSAALSTCVLKVYPREKWLVFFYCPNGASHTKNTRALVFSYSQDKIKDGGYLPCTGPLSISARSATRASLSGVPYLLSGHQSDGHVYVEDSTDIQATGYQVHDSSNTLVAVPILPVIRTRKLYPSGYSRDGRVQRIYILHDAIGTTITAATVTTTAGSAVVTSSGLFGSVIKGMLVRGNNIPPGCVVITFTSSNQLTLSAPATADGTTSLTFDTGTLAITMRVSGIDETVFVFDTFYTSTLTGDLLVTHHDDTRQGIEMQIEKVVLPDASSADLGVAMRLHSFTWLADDLGSEMNRAT